MKPGREKTVAQFQQLRQFLEELEKLLLVQLDMVEKEIARKRDEHLAKISEDLSSLERKMQEMDEKRQQSESELLQDIRSTMTRCEENTFEKSVVFSPALKWKIWDVCDINPFLEGFMKQFQEALISGLQLKKANVSLDPGTGEPCLILSKDHKSVKFEKQPENLFYFSVRFDFWPYALGLEGFRAGRHFWEVIVGSEDKWSVGVARKSVRENGMLNSWYDVEICIMGKWDGEYRASVGSKRIPLSLREEPKKIRVSLDYDGGQVAFHDADTAALIYTSAGPFSGKTLRPFFWVSGKAHLTLSP